MSEREARIHGQVCHEWFPGLKAGVSSKVSAGTESNPYSKVAARGTGVVVSRDSLVEDGTARPEPAREWGREGEDVLSVKYKADAPPVEAKAVKI